ncbi:MAG: hypothetical protein IT317_03455 [Anaerolineales bacterium]|nr:hypothetical protein [Anaerolineales bacterium]
MRTYRSPRALVPALLGLCLPALPAVVAPSQSAGGYTLFLPLVQRSEAPANPVHSGVATYYDATGNGACLFGEAPDDLMVTALNAVEYDTAAWCGADARAALRGPIERAHQAVPRFTSEILGRQQAG